MPKKAIVGIVVAIAVSVFGVSQATAATSSSTNLYSYKDAQACASKTQAYNRGDKGKCISVLQEGLVDAGYNIGKSGKDGSLGADTSQALNLFKEANGLDGNGWAGYGTYNALVPFMRNADYRRQQKITGGSKATNSYSYKDAQGCASKRQAYNLGDKGKCISVLQEGLVDAGYNIGKDGKDGQLGTDTMKALNQFKAGNGLEANGWAGYGTFNGVVPFMRNADYLRWANTPE